VIRSRAGAAVLGSPIAHSLSPALHRAAYDALGLAGWTYRAIECAVPELGDVLRALDDEGLAGASLTMPLKQAVVAMLATADPLVTEVGAANTVLFGDVAGEWHGVNTDVPGMVDALAGIDVPDTATVLGAGATAGSAVVALASLGVTHVVVRARRPAAAAGLVSLAAGRGLVIDIERWPEDAAALRSPLVVSTVPAGAADDVASGFGGAGDRSGQVLFDVVYAPWPTPLVEAWVAAGGEVIGGLELLVAQAAHQVRLMTGAEPPVEAMRAAVEAVQTAETPGDHAEMGHIPPS
jgi:shikimate dehydrogenase